jgi:hypothetical protein
MKLKVKPRHLSSYSDKLRAGRPGFDSLYSIASRPPSSSKVKNGGAIPPEKEEY